MAAAASPAHAATDGSASPAVWIALGVVFLGAFLTVGSAIYAAVVKKKESGSTDA